MLRPVGVIRGEQLAHAIELVEQLLEPELVHLMDDDEQQFVVFRSVRARLLQREEVVDAQIAAVGHGAIR